MRNEVTMHLIKCNPGHVSLSEIQFSEMNGVMWVSK